MRGWAALVVVLLIAPVAARGSDVGQPLPTNGQCAVPVDPQWTSQEKFVWQHVCVGEMANFDDGPSYGGNLDPKRPEGLPDSRILRSSFLETILLADKYRRALTRRGVHIVGARFTETVDLIGAQLEHELWLDKSLLEQGADFSGARSTDMISIGGSKVTGTLNMNSLHVDQSLFMGGAEFHDVNLIDANIGMQIDLTGSKVTRPLKCIRCMSTKIYSWATIASSTMSVC
jgi:hypothetical protein